MGIYLQDTLRSSPRLVQVLERSTWIRRAKKSIETSLPLIFSEWRCFLGRNRTKQQINITDGQLYTENTLMI